MTFLCSDQTRAHEIETAKTRKVDSTDGGALCTSPHDASFSNGEDALSCPRPTRPHPKDSVGIRRQKEVNGLACPDRTGRLGCILLQRDPRKSATA
jgi:hypothetical protein